MHIYLPSTYQEVDVRHRPQCALHDMMCSWCWPGSPRLHYSESVRLCCICFRPMWRATFCSYDYVFIWFIWFVIYSCFIPSFRLLSHTWSMIVFTQFWCIVSVYLHLFICQIIWWCHIWCLGGGASLCRWLRRSHRIRRSRINTSGVEVWCC